MSSFQELPVLAKLVTRRGVGDRCLHFANKNVPIADFMIAFVASVEIIVGVDFKSGYGVEIPEPISPASVNAASAVGLRLWERKRRGRGKRGDDDTNNNTR